MISPSSLRNVANKKGEPTETRKEQKKGHKMSKLEQMSSRLKIDREETNGEDKRRSNRKKKMKKLDANITKAKVSSTLEGSLYIWRKSEWEETLLALFLIEDDCLALVEFYSEDNKFAKTMSILDEWTLRKERNIQLSSKQRIYPFTICRSQQNITLAAHSGEERRQWISALLLSLTSCPVNLEAYFDPCIVCNAQFEILGINSEMLKFLGQDVMLGKKLSSLIPSFQFESFASMCSSISNPSSPAPLHRHFDFSFCLKKQDLSETPAAFHVSLLKNNGKLLYLCQLIASPNPPPSNNAMNFDSLDAICRTPVIAMLESLQDLSKEYSRLRFKLLELEDQTTSASSTPSNSLESNTAPISSASTPEKTSSGSLTSSSQMKELIDSESSTLRRAILPETKENEGLDNRTISRTDGYTLTSTFREVLVTPRNRSASIFSTGSGKTWSNVSRRVTVVGGGNSLLFAWHLALTGSLVTIVEYQNLRAEQINEQQWHLLDEVSSPCAVACAALLMDAIESKTTNVTNICATTNLAVSVAYSDIIILETPYPFDDLFCKQLEDIKAGGLDGQFILLDCNVENKQDLENILRKVTGMIPWATFLCATTCGNIQALEAQFHARLGKPQRLDLAAELLINSSAREFMNACVDKRIETLVSGPKNSDLASSIGRWFLTLARDRM